MFPTSSLLVIVAYSIDVTSVTNSSPLRRLSLDLVSLYKGVSGFFLYNFTIYLYDINHDDLFYKFSY